MRQWRAVLRLLLILLAAGAMAVASGVMLKEIMQHELMDGKREDQVLVTDSDSALVDYSLQFKKIAITFDDGPHPEYTPQLLEGLKERGVKATFFVIGASCEEYPELLEQIRADGHLIGNHTYTHIQLTSRNQENFEEELVKTNGIIRQITGEAPAYVRPPFGCWNEDLEGDIQMFPVMWTIDPQDWCTSSAKTVAHRVIENADEDAIILLHDCYQSSIDAAFMIIDALIGEGYEFVTVDEILFP